MASRWSWSSCLKAIRCLDASFGEEVIAVHRCLHDGDITLEDFQDARKVVDKKNARFTRPPHPWEVGMAIVAEIAEMEEALLADVGNDAIVEALKAMASKWPVPESLLKLESETVGDDHGVLFTFAVDGAWLVRAEQTGTQIARLRSSPSARFMRKNGRELNCICSVAVDGAVVILNERRGSILQSSEVGVGCLWRKKPPPGSLDLAKVSALVSFDVESTFAKLPSPPADQHDFSHQFTTLGIQQAFVRNCAEVTFLWGEGGGP